MFFSKFPTFVARLGNEQKIVTDFFAHVVAGDKFARYFSLLMPYTVKDGERIEHVAYKVYKDANYHWVIILLNKMSNPVEDWPLSENDLLKIAQEKYGESLYSVRHYELRNGVMIHPDLFPIYDPADIVEVTNWEYETRLNDAKRNIMLLDPKYLNEFEMNLMRELQ
jgi:hypothetical protein